MKLSVTLNHQTDDNFVQTVNTLKGKVTFLFITHQLLKWLQVDEAVILGKGKNNQRENQLSTIAQNNLQSSKTEKVKT